MKKPRLINHHYGFTIMLSQNASFNMEINDWRFIPSVEFHRRPNLVNIVVFAFLCFSLEIHRWRLYKK